MGAKEKRVQAKSPGPKNPRGVTKNKIVMYLLTGKKTRQEIINYIKEESDVDAPRGIQKHIDDLRKKGVIARDLFNQGHEQIYFLTPGFEGITNIFNYYDDENKRIEILKSPYIQSQINEDIFPILTRKLMQESISAQYEILINPVKQSRSNPKLSFFFPSPNVGLTEKQRKVFLQLFIDTLKLKKIEDFTFDIFNNLFTKNEIEFSKILFPQNERNEILNILKSSISAVSFLTSLENEKFEKNFRLFLPNMLGMKEVMMKFIFNNNIFEQPEAQNKKKSTFLLYLLQTELIHDFINDKCIENDWLKNFIVKIFFEFEKKS